MGGRQTPGGALAGLLVPLIPFERRQPGRQVLTVTLLAFSFLRSDAALAIRSSPRSAAGSARQCIHFSLAQEFRGGILTGYDREVRQAGITMPEEG